MKHKLLLGMVLFSLSGSLMAAQSLCQQKEQDIQREIEMAQKHNNQRRVNGLERALTEVRAGCTDKKLKASHLEKLTLRSRKWLSVSANSRKSATKVMTRTRLRNANTSWKKHARSLRSYRRSPINRIQSTDVKGVFYV